MSRVFSFLLILLVALPLSASGMWSIYWVTAPLSCFGYWAAPIVSSYGRPLCPFGAFSICPTPGGAAGPFDTGAPISITGWQLTQILSDPTASGYAVVGSAHATASGPDGGDVFASGGGVGTWSRNSSLSPALPQGGTGHIDAYAVCDKGTQQLILVLPYSSP
jgi:hypothetical protein